MFLIFKVFIYFLGSKDERLEKSNKASIPFTKKCRKVYTRKARCCLHEKSWVFLVKQISTCFKS